MENSRTRNAVLNSIFGIISYVLVIVAAFGVRKVLASTLGPEYLGLNSLFTNIISLLSLTDIGLQTSIVYFLFKPLNDNNREKIKSYLAFYKKLYYIIGIIIMLLGVVLIFVLPYIANTTVEMNKVQIFFILYVFNTAISYPFAYKKNLISADQKGRVLSTAHAITKIISSALQIMVLFLWNSFIGFIILLILCTLADCLVGVIYANKHYPYIKEKNCEKLTKTETKEITVKLIPILIQSLAGFVVTSTDSIIISSYISVAVVGIYSNYTLVTTTLKQLFGQVFASFTTSFGNLSVSSSKERCYEVYKKALYVGFFMAAIMCAGFTAVSSLFMEVFFGPEYIMDYGTMILIIISFYVICMNTPARSAQNALGLHSADVWAMVGEILVNIGVSIGLVYCWGVNGVVVGTIAAVILMPTISKDFVLNKYFFKQNVWSIYLMQLFYAVITVAISALNFYLFNTWITKSGIGWLILEGLASVAITSILLIALTFYLPEFKFLVNKTKSYFVGLGKKFKKA